MCIRDRSSTVAPPTRTGGCTGWREGCGARWPRRGAEATGMFGRACSAGGCARFGAPDYAEIGISSREGAGSVGSSSTRTLPPSSSVTRTARAPHTHRQVGHPSSKYTQSCFMPPTVAAVANTAAEPGSACRGSPGDRYQATAAIPRAISRSSGPPSHRYRTDALGHTSRTEYDAGNRVTATVAPSGARTTYTYDAVDQLLTVTDPLGGVTTTTYDAAGRPVTVTDADGRAVATTYDDAGRPTVVTRADASTLSWAYDASGRVLAYTDAAGVETTYTYDAAGRRASATDTAGRTTSYAYGPSGLPDTVTLPDGQHVDYAYDAAGRRTGVDYSDATPDVSFTYDDAVRATAMTDGTGATAYSYDALGRPLEVDGPDTTVGYEWDAVGQLTALTYPTGEVVERAHDDVGQLASVTDWADREYGFDWTIDGQLSAVTYPNGVETAWNYDAAGQVLGITEASAAGLDMLALAYGYSGAGLLVDQGVTRSAEGRAPPVVPSTSASQYTWDPLGRVSEVTGAGAGLFGFDAAGSVTALADGRSLTYDAGRQLTSMAVPAAGGLPAATPTFGYDGRGNRATATTDVGSSAGTVSHAFDLADRLTSVTAADGAVTTYAYDGGGLRASATTGAGAGAMTEEFTWDVAASVPLLLTDAEHAFVYGVSGTPLAQVGLVGGAVDYLHTDLIGSVVATTGSTAQVTSEADYDVYGLAVAVAGQVRNGEVTRFGYAGEYADPTGYVYLRVRYYDPATAQFLTRDPLVDVTGSPYGYTDGHPLQFTDPLGLEWWNPFLSLIH